MIKRKVHWSAVVGVTCSFWFLFWLFCFALSLYDTIDPNLTGTATIEITNNAEVADNGNDITGQRSFMIMVAVFALWAAYRSKKRLDLLRNGEFRSATIIKETSEGFDYNSGATSKVTLTNYRYLINKQSYTNTLWWAFGLKRGELIEIVYHTRKPGYSRIASRLRARFDRDANQWLSSMWHVIPRLTLLAVILAGIIAVLLSGIFSLA
jgi:hypothetical protein